MENVSDEQISLLVDIGQKMPLSLDAEKRKQVEALITAGLIVPAKDGEELAPYELTAKAQRFLSERGVGLNEA